MTNYDRLDKIKSSVVRKGNDMNAKEMRTKEQYQEALDELEMNAVTWASNKGLTPNDDDITKLIKYAQLLQELIDNYKENK